MFPWEVTINLYDENNKLMAEIVSTKYFATKRDAEEYAHSEGQKACNLVPGYWYTIGVE